MPSAGPRRLLKRGRGPRPGSRRSQDRGRSKGPAALLAGRCTPAAAGGSLEAELGPRRRSQAASGRGDTILRHQPRAPDEPLHPGGRKAAGAASWERSRSCAWGWWCWTSSMWWTSIRRRTRTAGRGAGGPCGPRGRCSPAWVPGGPDYRAGAVGVQPQKRGPAPPVRDLGKELSPLGMRPRLQIAVFTDSHFSPGTVGHDYPRFTHKQVEALREEVICPRARS